MKTPARRSGSLVLVLLLVGATCLVAQSQRKVEKAARQFASAFDKEDWPKAIELGEELVELSRKNHLHPYNLACAYARSGAVEPALVWLERAVEAGFSDSQGLREDSDLAVLRSDEGFVRIAERAQENYDRARALFRHMAKGSEAVIVAPPDSGTEPLPVLLLLHGFGDETTTFTRNFEAFARREGLLLVGVRSVVPVGETGFEWASPVDTGVQIESALDQAAESHSLDRARVYLLGFSQGGRMALEAAISDGERYRGIVAVGARIREHLAEDSAAETPPLFLMVGGEEEAAASNRRGAKALEEAGRRVELRIYPGVGHAFPQSWEAEVRSALRWFEKWPAKAVP